MTTVAALSEPAARVLAVLLLEGTQTLREAGKSGGVLREKSLRAAARELETAGLVVATRRNGIATILSPNPSSLRPKASASSMFSSVQQENTEVQTRIANTNSYYSYWPTREIDTPQTPQTAAEAPASDQALNGRALGARGEPRALGARGSEEPGALGARGGALGALGVPKEQQPRALGALPPRALGALGVTETEHASEDEPEDDDLLLAIEAADAISAGDPPYDLHNKAFIAKRKAQVAALSALWASSFSVPAPTPNSMKMLLRSGGDAMTVAEAIAEVVERKSSGQKFPGLFTYVQKVVESRVRRAAEVAAETKRLKGEIEDDELMAPTPEYLAAKAQAAEVAKQLWGEDYANA